MKKWLWFAGGILVGVVLVLLGNHLATSFQERRELAELEEGLDAGLKVSNFLDWPVRDDVILTMEHEVYPVGVDIVYARLENASHKNIMYGDTAIHFERKVAGQWYQVPTGPRNSLLMGTDVEEGEFQVAFECPEYETYDYPEGHYRMVLCYTHGPSWASSKRYVAFAEFEIRGTKEPETYGNIRFQSLREKRAIKDGCLVIRDGELQNLEQVEFTVKKAARKLPGQLRIVDLDQRTVTDILIDMDWEARKKVYTIVQRDGRQVTTETLEDLDQWKSYEELRALVVKPVVE